MPKYYCDYCDVFLTHDSSSVRKAHNAGRNHLQNVKDWYSSLGNDRAQNLIDEITKSLERSEASNRFAPGASNPMMRPGLGSGPPPGPPMGGMPFAPPPAPAPFVPPANPNQSLGLPPIEIAGSGGPPKLVAGMNPARAALLGIR